MKTTADLATFFGVLRENLPFLGERHQVESLGVFGPYVRNVQRADSDLDLFVTVRKPPSLLQSVKLENYLSDLLGVKVDLVMKDSLKRSIDKRILREVMPLVLGRTSVTLLLVPLRVANGELSDSNIRLAPLRCANDALVLTFTPLRPVPATQQGGDVNSLKEFGRETRSRYSSPDLLVSCRARLRS